MCKYITNERTYKRKSKITCEMNKLINIYARTIRVDNWLQYKLASRLAGLLSDLLASGESESCVTGTGFNSRKTDLHHRRKLCGGRSNCVVEIMWTTVDFVIFASIIILLHILAEQLLRNKNSKRRGYQLNRARNGAFYGSSTTKEELISLIIKI